MGAGEVNTGKQLTTHLEVTVQGEIYGRYFRALMRDQLQASNIRA